MAALSRRDEVKGCLIWLGSTNDNGYGKYGKRALGAHRVAYEEAHGPIPGGMCVCHSCDTPRCIEPTHLFLGTHLVNAADCVAKGRHFSAKLTASDVRAIRGDGRSRAEVAATFNVSVTTVRRICNGHAWLFVT